MASIPPGTSGAVDTSRPAPQFSVRESCVEVVPEGFRGLRGDVAHYCRIQAARGFLACLLIVVSTPSLWALAVYRFGRWLRFGQSRPSFAKRLLGPLHTLLFEL